MAVLAVLAVLVRTAADACGRYLVSTDFCNHGCIFSGDAERGIRALSERSG